MRGTLPIIERPPHLSMKMFRLIIAFQPVLGIPFSSSGLDYKKFIENGINPVPCLDSEYCCEKVLWPSWSKRFIEKGVTPPVFSEIDNFYPSYNRVGSIIFQCIDTRDDPAGEAKERGLFIGHCPRNSVVTSWPTTRGYFGTDDPNNRNSWHHRGACAPIMSKMPFTVHAGSFQCTMVYVKDASNEVITVFAVNHKDRGQLMQNWLNISMLDPVSRKLDPTVTSFSVFAPSLSVVGQHDRYYKACVYNFNVWSFVNPKEPLEPKRMRLNAFAVTSPDTRDFKGTSR